MLEAVAVVLIKELVVRLALVAVVLVKLVLLDSSVKLPVPASVPEPLKLKLSAVKRKLPEVLTVPAVLRPMYKVEPEPTLMPVSVLVPTPLSVMAPEVE